ncbi:MAG: GTP cyclohydrolase II [Rhodospirillales bacterium]|nr:GTP cyclohydrolase II [Rhodospirillales bacterium]
MLARRAVDRAAAELAAGTPVLLADGCSHVVLAAETASLRSLAEFVALAGTPPGLLLAPARAAAVLRQPLERGTELVALRLDGLLLTPELLLALADPSSGLPIPTGLEPAAAEGAACAPAALALAREARLLPAALIAPLGPGGGAVAARLRLLSVSPAEIAACSAVRDFKLRRLSEARVPLEAAGDTRIIAFRAADRGTEQFAVLFGEPEARDAPLVRVHSACFTGDLLGSLRCDCGAQLRGAIARIATEGAGALLYLAEEGRGIGLMNKLRAYRLQDAGFDTLDANRALGWGNDERNYRTAAAMLTELGLTRVRLLTNSPDKLAALGAAGITIVGREALAFPPNGVNDRYLATKARRLGHLLG